MFAQIKKQQTQITATVKDHGSFSSSGASIIIHAHCGGGARECTTHGQTQGQQIVWSMVVAAEAV